MANILVVPDIDGEQISVLFSFVSFRFVSSRGSGSFGDQLYITICADIIIYNMFELLATCYLLGWFGVWVSFVQTTYSPGTRFKLVR